MERTFSKQRCCKRNNTWTPVWQTAWECHEIYYGKRELVSERLWVWVGVSVWEWVCFCVSVLLHDWVIVWVCCCVSLFVCMFVWYHIYIKLSSLVIMLGRKASARSFNNDNQQVQKKGPNSKYIGRVHGRNRSNFASTTSNTYATLCVQYKGSFIWGKIRSSLEIETVFRSRYWSANGPSIS